MVGDNRKAIARAVEPHLDRFFRKDTAREQVHGEGVEQLALNGAIEWSSTILRRIPNREEEVLAFVVEVELYLPVFETLLDLLESNVHNLEDILVRKGALNPDG